MTLYRRIATALTFALMFALIGGAQAARLGQPMELFLNNPIQIVSGAKPTKAQIESTVIKAGIARGWIITRNQDGTLNAHLAVRQHTLDVIITLKDNKFDIVYKDSTNLRYAPNPADPARPLIHPSDSKWVKSLIFDIQQNLATL